MSDACDHIAGVPVVDLARRFGTPTYVYDAAVIRRKIADLAAFDVVRYARRKPARIWPSWTSCAATGALVDAVSTGEIRRALAAGFCARTAARRRSSIRPTSSTASRSISASSSGIHVNCGSPDMIDQLGSRAARRTVTLRINPGFGHGHSRKTNTGGDRPNTASGTTQLGDCLERAARHGLTVDRAAHAHRLRHRPGAPFAGLRGAMERAAARGRPVADVARAGGGLPTIYRAATGTSIWTPISPFGTPRAKRLEDRFGHALRLEIEPGRYLVAESGFLLAEIRAVKRQDANMFYLADAGFNNLARPILYGSYHPMSIVPADGGPRGPEQEVIVGGPLCESGDIFTQEEGGFVITRRCPKRRVGDLLVIGGAGDYGFAMGSNYNSKPLAAEVLIDGGQPGSSAAARPSRT